MQQRGLSTGFGVAAVLTILSGGVLYWHDFAAAGQLSSGAVVFGAGGLLALGAAVLGGAVSVADWRGESVN